MSDREILEDIAAAARALLQSLSQETTYTDILRYHLDELDEARRRAVLETEKA
jgi:hypothetical protein